MPIRCGIRPVKRPALEGLQTGEADKNEVNFIPSAAIRSIFGVAISVAPKHPISPYPKSSAKMKTIFGRSDLAAFFSFEVQEKKQRGKKEQQ